MDIKIGLAFCNENYAACSTVRRVEKISSYNASTICPFQLTMNVIKREAYYDSNVVKCLIF